VGSQNEAGGLAVVELRNGAAPAPGHYALALPHGDEDFRLALDRALSHLYREGQITATFSQSFQQGTTPSGILKTLYLISGLPD
jgi:hypothetical protein